LSQRLDPLHRQLNLLARSPSVVRSIVTLQKGVPRVYPMSIPDDMSSIKERYQAIFSAMRERDARTVEELMRATSLLFANRLSENLDRHGPKVRVSMNDADSVPQTA
jgi:hypothetical protein